MQKQYVTISLSRDEYSTILNLCAGRLLALEEKRCTTLEEGKEHKALYDLRMKLIREEMRQL